MMRAVSALSLAAILGASCLIFAQEPHAVFHSFDFPGATNTQATSMTPWGEIVGRYYNPDGSEHGFLWRRGVFTSIDFPGALITEADWINDDGVIVGYYNNGDPNHPNHGYKLTDGRFETIDYPGSGLTFLGGIGNNGEIVGAAATVNGTKFIGFLLREGIFSPIVFPDPTITYQEATMIAAGRIVGGYSDAVGSHGYLLADGRFRSINCPNAPGGVFLSAIDSLGRVAGEMTTADGHSHGLVVSHGECIAVDFPESTATYANSIDDYGDIAGRYTDAAGNTHGFFVEHLLPGYWESEPFLDAP
jgi:uncharacterized membrane protein